MSPALVAHQSAAMLRTQPRRRNRRRRTALRASLRRVTIAAAIASAVTLAALAASAIHAADAAHTERTVAEIAETARTGDGPLTVGALGSVPRDLERRAWQTWSERTAERLRRHARASAEF